MGFLRRLLGLVKGREDANEGKPASTPPSARDESASEAGPAGRTRFRVFVLPGAEEPRSALIPAGNLSIDAIGFEGDCNLSKDKHYVVGWSPPERDKRGWTYGRWALLDQAAERLVMFGAMKQPGPCHVGNNGTALIVNEAKAGNKKDDFLAVEARTKLFVVSPESRALSCLASFPTLIYESGVSADGKVAYCWLRDYRPPRHAELQEGELVLFDLDQHLELCRFVPDCGCPTTFHLDSAERIIELVFPEYSFRYSFEGVLLNPQVLEQVEELRRAEEESRSARYGYREVNRAHEILAKAGANDDIAQVQAEGLFREGLQKELTDFTRARVHRTLGELILSQGRKREALQEFQSALRLSPKIGLKRLEAKLRQELVD